MRKINRYCFITFVFLLFTAVSAFFPSHCTAEDYSLSITGIKKNAFPHISVAAYFKNASGGSENGVSQSSFSLTENKSRPDFTLKKNTSGRAVALIIDKSLYLPEFSKYTTGTLAKMASYFEFSDQAAIFNFSEGMIALDFTYDSKAIAGFKPDGFISSEKMPSEVVAAALEKLQTQSGDKSLIYFTQAPFELDSAALEKLSKMSKNNPGFSFNILKVSLSSELYDYREISAALSSLAREYNGLYAESNLEVTNVIGGMAKIMDYIKSNYELIYDTGFTYPDGRLRKVSLAAEYGGKRYEDRSSYAIDFNLPELNFGVHDNPVFYQEIDPADIENAGELGLSISSYVRFKNTDATAPQSAAYIGFGSFGADGRPKNSEMFLFCINNQMAGEAAQYKFNGTPEEDYFGKPGYAVKNERISFNVSENFIARGAGEKFKKCGIVWNNFYKNNNRAQWVRAFMSFIPSKIVTDGSVRYAVFTAGRSLAHGPREILFDGVQMQYGLVPTVFTETRTLYLGPDDVRRSMTSPLNPRIEYQMK